MLALSYESENKTPVFIKLPTFRFHRQNEHLNLHKKYSFLLCFFKTPFPCILSSKLSFVKWFSHITLLSPGLKLSLPIAANHYFLQTGSLGMLNVHNVFAFLIPSPWLTYVRNFNLTHFFLLALQFIAHHYCK